MTRAQYRFLSILAETKTWAMYRDETHWSMPDDSVLEISRAEVTELIRLDYVGGGSRFNPNILADEWWVAKITESGAARARKPFVSE